ncbi:hypothetical protein [Enterococcus wangshanyuanii]|uniref:Phage tail protein n=1 Tax=Enterococcus wangshanyuanii TaxID=2005703 RepID=A0ABQ1PU19_9ENTE|nr:hypothetical protein [Enterococcus wangshanyuanii]GGD03772.1 hypothetical protein GCM10011573_36570 [Enterococcus wangshanyuanii]
MAVEKILETDTLNQGRVKINAVLDQSNASSEKVDNYKTELTQGIDEAKKIATDAGDEAKNIAEQAGALANQKADQAVADSKTAVDTANRAVGTANQNKQEFDALRNEFDDLVAESGDSNPEIVQSRTDTEGIKQATLQARLTSDFNSRLTTADAMQLFSGSVNTPKMMDFKGKTAGNIASNPHQAFSDYTAATLKKPSANWNEFTQDNYNKVVARDDTGVSTGSSQNGVIPQQLYPFDVKAAIESVADSIFEGMTITEAVKYIKDHFVSIKISIRGKASSPGNKNLKVATFLESTDSYSVQMQNAASDYTDFTTEITDSNFIDSNGKINVLVFSDSSNGVTPASIDVDYIGVQITVSLSALDVLNKSGFVKDDQLKDHTENTNNPHDVTKEQVGLGNVPNYSAATDTEAILGTSPNKLMTPKNVSSAIDAKAVKIEGDQDVNGVKNFTSVPQINNIPIAIDQGVAFKEITLDATINANIKSGFIRLWRIGSMVIVGAYLSLKGPVRWVNLGAYPTGFAPQSPASFGIALGSTGGEQLPATMYAGSGNYRILTSGSVPTTGYDFQGSGVYVTEADFPS